MSCLWSAIQNLLKSHSAEARKRINTFCGQSKPIWMLYNIHFHAWLALLCNNCVWYLSLPRTQSEDSASTYLLSVHLRRRSRQQTAQGKLVVMFLNVWVMHRKITSHAMPRNDITVNLARNTYSLD